MRVSLPKHGLAISHSVEDGYFYLEIEVPDNTKGDGTPVTRISGQLSVRDMVELSHGLEALLASIPTPIEGEE